MLKKTDLATILILSSKLFCQQQWLTGTAIPQGTSASVKEDVSLAYNPNSSKMFAGWADTGGPAYASIYSGGTWTTDALTMSGNVTEDVFLSYNSTDFSIFAAWGDNNSMPELPYFSIYNGVSWSVPATIPLGGSSGVHFNANLAYYASITRMIAAWSDSLSAAPYFSSYNGMTWTTSTISLGASSGAGYDVKLAYDSIASRIVGAWADEMSNAAYASRYDGMVWTTAAIPLGSSSGVFRNVTLAFDPDGNRMFAAWVDVMTRQLYYSIYSAGSWSIADTIPLGMSAGGNLDVYLAYDPTKMKLFAAWANFGSSTPFYNIFSGSSWGAAGMIDAGNSIGAATNIILAYHTGLNEMFSAWQSFSDSAPYWSPYAIPPAPSISRPPNFQRPYNRRIKIPQV